MPSFSSITRAASYSSRAAARSPRVSALSPRLESVDATRALSGASRCLMARARFSSVSAAREIAALRGHQPKVVQRHPDVEAVRRQALLELERALEVVLRS